MRFSEKVVLVTGAGSGIGRAAAVRVAHEGAAVVVNDLDASAASEVAHELAGLGTSAIAVAADVSIPAEAQRVVGVAMEEFAGLHGAVNCAGIPGPRGLLADIAIDDYRRLIEVNLNAVFYCMHAQIPAMLPSGGSIVNMSSVLGLVGKSTMVAYSTAKHGLVGMTRSAALAYASQGIRVNSVHPGHIATPILDAMPKSDYDALVDQYPIRRLGSTQEIASLVAFLLSGEANFITGAQYVADGGYTAQ